MLPAAAKQASVTLTQHPHALWLPTRQVAGNGREAVQAVERCLADPGACPPFDVILMDMCMPVLGGVDATQARTGARGGST